MSALRIEQGTAEAAPAFAGYTHDTYTFDPWTWLCAFTDVGGGYALASGRKLWLVVDQVPTDALTPIMAALVGHPDRQEAVRSTIERRQNGQAA